MIDAGQDDRGVSKVVKGSGGYAPDTPRSLQKWAESFLENAPAPVSIIQRDGYRLMYANSAFRRLHAMAAPSLDLPISDFLDPRAAGELQALIDRGVSAGVMAHEGIITTNPGDRALHCSVWPITDSGGGDLALVMIEMHLTTDAEEIRVFQVDVTQRLLLSALRDQMVAEAAGAEKKVAELANAAKDRFLTTMSHELRTPLNAIGGYAELIDLGLRGPVTAAQREDLSRIQRAQEHLLGLINAVLNFSKLESGSVQYDMTAVTLDSTLDAVLEMLAPHLVRRGLTFDDGICVSPIDPPVIVNADPEKLRQILINLLTNSIKFTEPGGTIRASCDIKDGRVSVHISDTGRGIPADQLSTIFDPFVQVGRRLNSGDQGVGLGLSISRDLAHGMGGDLTAISTPGVGSTFTLTLERASRDAPPSP